MLENLYTSGLLIVSFNEQEVPQRGVTWFVLREAVGYVAAGTRGSPKREARRAPG